MAIIKCKMCGGDLVIEPGSTVAECEYCGSRQTVPTADNEKKLTLFARANRLRSGCEFDKAAGVYESIVADFPQEAEAYWGLVLCKYGIEYVDDPATGKKIPTCHRSSFDSVMEDSDFEQACENADTVAQKVYREEAKEFERIRKGILEVSSTEKPYDIFICYKETDEKGERTLDSVLAQDLYTALTEKGYRVFFSRVTLRDKLGQAYEPYIFAALNSAKVMLAVGTCYEYYNAVWVKNEWSRYLKLMAADKSKHLIPCYKDLDPEDMPREFKHLQGADLGKMGAIQDILFNMEKYIPLKKQTVVQERVVVEAPAAGGKIASLLQRGVMALEDGDWNKADGFFEEVLNNDFQNAQAYIGKALMQERQKTLDGLVRQWMQSTESAKPETLTLKPEEAHIEKAVQDYAIAGYLEPDDIRKAYHFDLSYPSTVSVRQQQYQKAKAQWENHQWLSKAEKFASGQAKQTLEQGKKTLFDTLDQRISNAKSKEEASRKAVEQRYREFLAETDKKIQALSRQKLAQKEADDRQRENRYQELVSRLDTARTIEALGQLAEDFRKLGSYRDSAAHAKTCEKRRDALLAREAAKRRKRNIRIAACLVLIAAAVAVVKYIVIPALDYQNAVKLMEQGEYEEAITAFTAMGDYRDSEAQIQACEIGILDREYNAAAALMEQGSYEEAITAFSALNGHRDSAAQIQACETAIQDVRYDAAAALMAQGSYEEAITAFTALKGYRDSKEQIQACKTAILDGEYDAAVALMAQGSYEEAIAAFTALNGHRDSAAQIQACETGILNRRYDIATALMAQGKYEEAITAFTALNGHRDSAAKIQACKIAILDREYDAAVALKEQGMYEDAITAFSALNGHRDSATQIQACETAILDGKYDAAAALMAEGKYEDAITAFTAMNGHRDSVEQIQACETAILDGKYDAATALMAEGKYEDAITAFSALNGHRDSAAQIQACETTILDGKYDAAAALMAEGKYEDAITAFTALNGHRDSAAQIQTCKTIILDGKYDAAVALMEQGKYEDAITVFTALDGYRDSAEQIQACNYAIAEVLLANGQYFRAVQAFNKLGDYQDARQRCMEVWNTVDQRDTISAGTYHTVGLKTDGTVVAVGGNWGGRCDVSDWKDIVAISVEIYHTVGLKADGTVVAVGYNKDGQCDVSGWKDIVAISAGGHHTVGLKADGTVVAVGDNEYGQCDVGDWEDIVAISAGGPYTVGLKANGTVVAVGDNEYGQCDVGDWEDIVAISAGYYHTVGLKADGTVVTVGSNKYGQCDVGGWKDIVAISAEERHTVGLKADSTVVAVGSNKQGQCNVSDWTGIVAISAGFNYTIGLKADGTVVAVGKNEDSSGNHVGQCDVSGWKDIKIPAKP